MSGWSIRDKAQSSHFFNLLHISGMANRTAVRSQGQGFDGRQSIKFGGPNTAGTNQILSDIFIGKSDSD